MSEVTALPLPETTTVATTPRAHVPRTIGLVVHPSRNVDEPLRLLREWADERGIEVVQARRPALSGRSPRRAIRPRSDLIVSIGGDGTTLAALRAGAVAGRPVLGIACGSLGALASVTVGDVKRSLERFSRGDWYPRRFPGAVGRSRRGHRSVRPERRHRAAFRRRPGADRRPCRTESLRAHRRRRRGREHADRIERLRDLSRRPVARLRPRRLRLHTACRSTAGSAPPLVVGSATELALEVTQDFGGGRLEIDGQVADERVQSLRIGLRA